MFILAAAPPAAVSAPMWLERPSAEEVSVARAKYDSTDTVDALLQMHCYVQADGHLTLCTGDRALLKLAPRYRLDRTAYTAPKVSVAVDVKKLYDSKGVVERGPIKADLIAIGGSGVAFLLCRVSESGVVGDCEADDSPTGGPALPAADMVAARQVAALYHYRPATLNGRPQPFYSAMAIALGDPSLIQRPDWLKKPSGQELESSYPKVALRLGVDGRVVMECKVAGTGAPYDCSILSERPLGVGFGDAALKLSDKFLMRPERRNGAVFEGGIVRIPLNFLSGGPDGPATGFRLLAWAPFSQAPSFEQVQAAVPEQARAAHRAGASSLRCELTSSGGLTKCVGLGEADNAAFDAAAQSLTPLFRANMGDHPPEGGNPLSVEIVFAFPSLPVSSALPRYIHKPDWVRSFGADDVVAAYPPKAVAAGVLSGGAVLDCRIVAEGRLDACSVQTETPADLGFGEAASKVALAMQANLWTREGDPTVGARVKLPMKFVYSGDASPTPAAAR